MLFSVDNETKPILKWAGGKHEILDQLFVHFPACFERYVEPFFGGGAVFFKLNPSISAIINDSNKDLIELYQVLRDSPYELMKELDELSSQYSEEFYYKLRNEDPQSPLPRAARTIFLNKTGFNGLYRLNSKGKFNVPWGRRVKCPALYKPEKFLEVSHRLSEAILLNQDFEAVINDTRQGDFIYCDPPYHPISPTSHFNSYAAGGFSRKCQKRLKDACERAAARGAFVAVSNSSSNFMNKMYEGWNVKQISAKRRINCKGAKRGPVNEILALLGCDEHRGWSGQLQTGPQV